MASCSPALWNVIVLGVGFLLLFSAYNTIQGYSSTLLGTLGETSLALLYATVAASVLLAPWAVGAIGPKRGLIIGAVAYVAYMLALVTGVPGIILAGSVVIGLGSAALWVAFGLISNANAAQDDAFGQYLGYFWACLQMSNVLGNLATFLVLARVKPGPALFGGFAVAGAAGTCVLLLLRPVAALGAPAPAGDDAVGADGRAALLFEDEARADASPSPSGLGSTSLTEACRLAVAALRAVADRRLLPLLPLFFLTGAELAFWNGSLPLLARPDRVGLVLVAVGTADVIGGAIFGWLGDVLGRATVMVAGCVLVAGGCGACLAIATAGAPASGVAALGPAWGDVPAVVWGAAVLFGLGDAALNTQAYAVLGDLFERRDGAEADREGSVLANTVFQLFNNVGSAAGFYAAIPLPLVVDVGAAPADSSQPHAFRLGTVALAATIIGLAAVSAIGSCCVPGAARGRWCGKRRESAGAINRRLDWDGGSDTMSV